MTSPAPAPPPGEQQSNWWVFGCIGAAALGVLGVFVLLGLILWTVSQPALQAQRRAPGTMSTSTDAEIGDVSPPRGFARTPGRVFYLDLDTMSGHQSSWDQQEIAPSSVLHARFRVVRLGQDAYFVPAFWFWARSLGPKPDSMEAGLELSPTDGLRSPFGFRAAYYDGHRLSQVHLFKLRPALLQWIGVTIDWTTPHRVTISLSDGESHSLQIPWTVGSVKVSSSTGEIEVDPLELGMIH
ncbi:MAG TPA: hypothetical protein VKF82_02340 [Candidatus Eremiobacteraceae bacterium]|nr:hypothetical protein [Candidatus Eremiobacteraceae bacterium]